ncbi:MAG: hypothetical protein GY822_23160 [Deltaproteobacteria bacterium]|nr:hypothetical protein [Deltaproteobacteria bacterium]
MKNNIENLLIQVVENQKKMIKLMSKTMVDDLPAKSSSYENSIMFDDLQSIVGMFVDDPNGSITLQQIKQTLNTQIGIEPSNKILGQFAKFNFKNKIVFKRVPGSTRMVKHYKIKFDG